MHCNLNILVIWIIGICIQNVDVIHCRGKYFFVPLPQFQIRKHGQQWRISSRHRPVAGRKLKPCMTSPCWGRCSQICFKKHTTRWPSTGVKQNTKISLTERANVKMFPGRMWPMTSDTDSDSCRPTWVIIIRTQHTGLLLHDDTAGTDTQNGCTYSTYCSYHLRPFLLWSRLPPNAYQIHSWEHPFNTPDPANFFFYSKICIHCAIDLKMAYRGPESVFSAGNCLKTWSSRFDILSIKNGRCKSWFWRERVQGV
jgi:hypothetical protein